MSEFIFEYYMFVFVAGLGAIQIGASVGRLKGLLVFKHPVVARIFGAALTFAALVWFFSTGERNINDYAGGIDANGQAFYAFLGSITAFIVTVVGTSLLNLRMGRGSSPPYNGMDSLRDVNFILALWRNLRYWSKAWRTLTKSYFFG